MGNSPQDVYAKCLPIHYGYPLWNPEPCSTLPEDHQLDGLQIGDVGIVDPDRGFEVLFNVCRSDDHPLHKHGIPQSLRHSGPIKLNREDVYIKRDAIRPGSVIFSGSVEWKSPGTGYEFTARSSEGAVLILPHGATFHDLRIKTRFRDLAIRNALDWYCFATEKRQRQIPKDSLYLITGFYKARSWSLALFQNAPPRGGGSMTATRIENGSDPVVNYEWKHTFPAVWKYGPGSGCGGSLNQSIFLRGYKIALKDNTFWNRHPEAEAISLHNFYERVSCFSFLQLPFSTRNKHPCHDSLVPDYLPQLSQPFHCSDIINHYLLNQDPNASVAITHDSEWTTPLELGKLKPDDLVLGDNLVQFLVENYSFESHDHVIYLRANLIPYHDGSKLLNISTSCSEGNKGSKNESLESLISELVQPSCDNTRVVITHIRADQLTVGLRRSPAECYVLVQFGCTRLQTKQRPVLAEEVTEWDDPILLPSDLSVTLRLSVCEFVREVAREEMLHTLELSVEELLDYTERGELITFPSAVVDGFESSCPSLLITIEHKPLDDPVSTNDTQALNSNFYLVVFVGNSFKFYFCMLILATTHISCGMSMTPLPIPLIHYQYVDHTVNLQNYRPREESLLLAKAAEGNGQWEDLVNYMKDITLLDQELTSEERDLFSIGYQNLVADRRASWSNKLSVEQEDMKSNVTSQSSVRCERQKLESEIIVICENVLDVLEKHLIPSTRSIESVIFYDQMVGDYYRSMSDFHIDTRRKCCIQKALTAYKDASTISISELQATHPTRLRVALKLSLFYYEILVSRKQALRVAQRALDDAHPVLDKLSQKDCDDSTVIMQLLHDNVTYWKSDNKEDGQSDHENTSLGQNNTEKVDEDLDVQRRDPIRESQSVGAGNWPTPKSFASYENVAQTTKESDEIEELRQALSESYSQIAELQKRLVEVQSKDLVNSDLNSSFDTVDKYFQSEIIRTLQRLNADMQQDTMYMADCLAEEFEFETLSTNPTPTAAAQRVSRRIGSILVMSSITNRPEDTPLLLQVAFQAYFASVLSQITVHLALETENNRFIHKIYRKLRGGEPQAISGYWRSLTCTHNIESWDKGSILQGIIEDISDIMLAAGCTALQSDIETKVSSMFKEEISLLLNLAMDLQKMLNDVISSDFTAFIPFPGDKFDPEMMDDAGDGEAGAEDASVLCTTHIGLMKRVPLGTLWEKGKKQRIVVLKAKVLLEPFSNTALEG